MVLSGELRFATVAAALAQAGGADTLDLTSVTRADSAGIALLLELRRRASKRGHALRISGANSQVRGLIRFFGLENILELS
ncbi:MAG: STAS domain-containing protein [Stenotrophobium sp.]